MKRIPKERAGRRIGQGLIPRVAVVVLLSGLGAAADTYNGPLQWHAWSTNNAEGTTTCNPTTNGQIQYQARYIVTNTTDEFWMKWEWNWWNKQVAANGVGFTSAPNNSVVWDSRVRMGGSDWSCDEPVDIHVDSAETGKWYILNITDTGNTLADSCNDSMAAFAVNEINHVGTLVTFGTPVASNDLTNLYLDSKSTAEQSGSNEELWFMYTTNDWATRSFVEISTIGANTVLSLPIGSAVKFGSLVKWVVGTFADTDTNTISGTTSGVQNFDAGAIEKYVARQHYVLRTLLENPSFEVPPTTNAPNAGAYHWKYGDPDTHGGYSNSASREQWRAHSDFWQAAIRGSWAGYDNGAWWQEITNEYDQGTIWEAGAWVWNDWNFTSAASRLKVEFYDGTGTRLGGNTNTFSNPGETWTYYSVTATAGADVAWVRWHIEAVGVGSNGALQIDDAVLWPSAPPVVTNYSVNGGKDVTDGQITGGTFSVVHWLYCADGVETTNTIPPYFRPNFDILNPSGTEILTDRVYASFTYQATGTTVVASNSTHSGADSSVVVLGVYTTRVSMISSNAAGITNTAVLEDGTPMTFEVVDDDTAVPRVSWENLIGNPGFETNAAGWSIYGIGIGSDATNGESSSGCIYVQEQGDGGYYRDAAGADDTIYVLTVRARKESGFDVVNNYLKLEFKDSAGEDLGNDNEINLNSLLTTNWQTFSVAATSPASGVVYVRPVIGVWDVGGSGSARAYFDNMALSRAAPLGVRIGATSYSASDLTTNAYFYLTDGDLANVSTAAPLRLIFGAYDVGSGLSRGTADPSTQMNVDVTNTDGTASFTVDNVADYDSAESSPYSESFEGECTSTWKWTSVSASDIADLMGTNRVTASLFDADNDRSDDRGIVTNQQFGYL
ncbi:MAG TPA: hypothetical protein EYP62_01935, partial [Kiritimatiellae bacterium]|nr:hypothetical protein [Kiritimatiellia bacterium]